jgi:hypothetical protein
VLHQNKGDTNARGHVGTELINKSETVVSIKKDDIIDPEISIAECEYSRNPPFEKMAFYVNQDGLPERADVPESEPTKERIHPGKYTEFQHYEVLNRIFTESDNWSWSGLVQKIKDYFYTIHNIEFGKSKARDFVGYYEAKGYIENVSDNQKSKYKLC